MTLLPPDIERPFRDHAERTAAQHLLSHRDRLLRTIEELAHLQVDQWSADEYAAFPQTTNGVPDPPPERLARWADIFAEELQEVHALTMQDLLDDGELRRALYFAGRLLATVTDLPLDMVDGFAIGRGGL